MKEGGASPPKEEDGSLVDQALKGEEKKPWGLEEKGRGRRLGIGKEGALRVKRDTDDGERRRRDADRRRDALFICSARAARKSERMARTR